MKINFAIMRINFALMKINFAIMKIDFALMKFNFALMKINFALIEICKLYSNENLLIIQKEHGIISNDYISNGIKQRVTRLIIIAALFFV